jgi:hypothetical protein
MATREGRRLGLRLTFLLSFCIVGTAFLPVIAG